MIAWLAIALGAEFAVVPVGGELHPLLPGRVWLAVTDSGAPLRTPPVVTATGGTVRFSNDEVGSGIWPLVITPDGSSPTVRLEVTAGGTTHVAEIGAAWPPGSLVLPARVEGTAQGGAIRVLLRGEGLPAPEHLDVQVDEGSVSAVEVVPEGIELVITPADSPLPRMIAIGVRDTTGNERPSWTEIRLRAQPRIPLEADRGSRVTIAVGDRSYGPFTADANGRIQARIDQYPGDSSARATLTDDLGNQVDSTIPLAFSTEPSLLLMAGARRAASTTPRMVWLRAIQAVGKPWRGDAPTCRSPAVGALPVLEVTPGVYAVPLEGQVRREGADVLVECRLQNASSSIRVGPKEGTPVRVLLQVWPTELSTDLPIADVRVALEDARGRRLPAEHVVVSAERGTITILDDDTEVVHGEYRGDAAITAGSDVLTAVLLPPAVGGPVAHLVMDWEPLRSGSARVRVLALDPEGVPARDQAISVSAGDDVRQGKTGDDGRLQLEVPVLPGSSPAVLAARSGSVVVRGLAIRGATRGGSVDTRGPLSQLLARQVLTLSPGRVSGLSVDIDPPILRTGSNSVAYITVVLEDRAGKAVEQDVTLVASDGRVGPLIQRPDGSFVAEYRPAPGDRARSVTVSASTGTLRTTSKLVLEPRLGRLAMGPMVGFVTNLGSINAFSIGLDADIRTGLLGETLLFRVGVAGYPVQKDVSTGFGGDADLRGVVIPVTGAVILRQDRAGVGLWGGAGGIVGAHTMTARFDNDLVSRGGNAISGGTVLGGVSYRFGIADLFVEGRYAWIPGPRGELAFIGNLGGLTTSTGFRLVY